MREPSRNYDELKNEHASADHAKSVDAKQAENAAAEPTWEEKLDADYQKLNDEATASFKAGRISARDLTRRQNDLDREKADKIHDKNREEAEARGETYVDPRRGPSPYADGVLRDGKDRERER